MHGDRLDSVELSGDDKVFIRRVLKDIETAYKVLVSEVESKDLDIRDFFTIRYCIIVIVESIATIASRIAGRMGYVIEGYVESIKFLVKQGIIDSDLGDRLTRLARLRNLLVHRYWEIDDRRIVEEARSNGLEAIKRVLDVFSKLIEG